MPCRRRDRISPAGQQSRAAFELTPCRVRGLKHPMTSNVYTDPRLWALAIAETLVWAGLYYLFPALLLHWEGDFGWARSDVTLAATCAILASALVAPRAGALIDRGHGRTLLTGSALLGAVMLVALTFVTTQAQFIAVWIMIGFSLGGCLYEPCFAHITHSRGVNAKAAITMITLIAGFAGTVSFPTANALAFLDGWRTAAMAFAGLIFLVAVPLFWYGAGLPGRATVPDGTPDTPQQRKTESQKALRTALRGPVFWLLAIGFATIALNHGIIVNHLLPILDESGVPTEKAVLAIALIGPMQVVGRLIMMAVEARMGMVRICGATFLFMALAGFVLLHAGAAVFMVFAFVALQGSGYGVTSITRPVVTAGLLGRTGFGAISGAMALPFVASTALAPTIGSLMWGWGGYDLVIMSLICVVLAGFLCFVCATFIASRKSPSEA